MMGLKLTEDMRRVFLRLKEAESPARQHWMQRKVVRAINESCLQGVWTANEKESGWIEEVEQAW